MAEYPDLGGKTREDAWSLLCEWVESPSLRRHCLSVETAMRAHGDQPGYERTTLLDKTLYAVDELTGFIAAVALVRPSKAVADVTASSVKKKMKDKRFAEGVNRAELVAGAEALGVPFDEHVTFVAAAMAANAEALGLAGEPAATTADAGHDRAGS